jgi:membrane protease YdiL (CAAX protease family)
MEEVEHTVMEDKPGVEQGCSNPWGFWSTIGLSLAIGAIALLGQIFIGVIWGIVAVIRDMNVETLITNGNFLMACTLISYPFVLGFMILFIKIRNGNTYVEYLAIRNAKMKSFFIWVVWVVGMILVMGVIGSQLDQPPPDIMITLISSSHIGLIILVLIIGAPLVEELFFRGFMFKGIAASRLGGVGAVTLTTIFWVGIHGFQYGWFALLQLTIFGVILGMARLKTESIVIPVLLHMANNAFAVLMLKLYLMYEVV